MCTYRSHEDTDTDHLYRMQLLQALHLSKWDDETVEERINDLFSKIQSAPEMAIILKNIRNNQQFSLIITVMGGKNIKDDLLFRLLFSYQLFDYAHRCIVDMLQKNSVDKDHLKQLLDNINIS